MTPVQNDTQAVDGPMVRLDDDARYAIARTLCDEWAAKNGHYGDDVWRLHSSDFYDDADSVMDALARLGGAA